MSKEIELLELLLDTEINNMRVFKPMYRYEEDIKKCDEDIERIAEKREALQKEYDSRLEHERLLQDTKAFMAIQKEDNR